MQLRKRLKGCFVSGVVQHEFDRIVELRLEGGGVSFILVFEFFSKGNVILCDGDRKILGLLEWQKWRDRKLGVGQTYEHPPPTTNPLSLGEEAISRILDESQRDVVRTIAVECGLPGLYAEEACARASVEKTTPARELGSSKRRVIESLSSIKAEVTSRKTSPKIILKEGEYFDVIPFSLRIYEGLESKEFNSFNEAADDYFSKQEFEEKKTSFESKFAHEKAKLENRLAEQETALSKAREDAAHYKQMGDLLFQHMHELTPLLTEMQKLRKQGLSDEEIQAKTREKGIVKNLKKTELTLEL